MITTLLKMSLRFESDSDRDYSVGFKNTQHYKVWNPIEYANGFLYLSL